MSDSIVSDKVLQRIRAMLDRTVENGCTEAEASAAAAKVSEVLAAHNLEMADLERHNSPTAAESGRLRDITARRATYDWQVNLMREIARANFAVIG